MDRTLGLMEILTLQVTIRLPSILLAEQQMDVIHWLYLI